MKKYILLCGMLLASLLLMGTACERADKETDMTREALEQCELSQKMEVPTLEEIKEPYSWGYYRKDLMKEKGLSQTEEFSDYYLYLQTIYKANLEAYLLETLDLQETDESLAASPWHIYPIEEQDQDVYARYSTMKLRYLNLRNNLYIEYLEEQDLALLENQLKNGKEVVTEELQNMVKDTYQNVIKGRMAVDGVYDEDQTFNTAYAQGQKPDIPNTAVIFMLAIGSPYDQNGQTIPGDTSQERNETVDQIREEKEKAYEKLLGVPVFIWKEQCTIKIDDADF